MMPWCDSTWCLALCDGVDAESVVASALLGGVARAGVGAGALGRLVAEAVATPALRGPAYTYVRT